MAHNTELLRLLEHSLAMVNARLVQVPDYAMFKSIKAQLETMLEDVQNDVIPSAQRKSHINIGLLAARELETTDPEFATTLMKTDYLYKRLA